VTLEILAPLSDDPAVNAPALAGLIGPAHASERGDSNGNGAVSYTKPWGHDQAMIATSLLAIQLRTLFILTGVGQIERENDPDCSAGPRFWFAGCASGNVIAVRRDVSDGVVAEILALAVAEPPFTAWNRPPRYLDRYVDLLSRDAPISERTLGLIYELPHRLGYRRDVELIDDQSNEGRCVHEALLRHRMPDGLVELGFRCGSDLWRPWCMARVDGDVVSVAFTARISEVGAELGIATVKAFRGRGYGAAAVAGWSRLPTLQSRQLFCSTNASNVSSQRVVARLGLRSLGASLRLS
jgi:RimJ/RimL family protein N-acetyltransferase